LDAAPFEFVVPQRPLSAQTRNREGLREWKTLVREHAEKLWAGPPRADADLHVIVVFVYDSTPIDVDNIVKPIQDALKGLAFGDDVQVSGVESHRRQRGAEFDPAALPAILAAAWLRHQEFVYVGIDREKPLGEYFA
jgi:crossover junction endodeoxyribonuclease RusA